MLTENFLKHIAVLGKEVRFSVFGISEESLVVIIFEKKTKWLVNRLGYKVGDTGFGSNSQPAHS